MVIKLALCSSKNKGLTRCYLYTELIRPPLNNCQFDSFLYFKSFYLIIYLILKSFTFCSTPKELQRKIKMITLKKTQGFEVLSPQKTSNTVLVFPLQNSLSAVLSYNATQISTHHCVAALITKKGIKKNERLLVRYVGTVDDGRRGLFSKICGNSLLHNFKYILINTNSFPKISLY